MPHPRGRAADEMILAARRRGARAGKTSSPDVLGGPSWAGASQRMNYEASLPTPDPYGGKRPEPPEMTVLQEFTDNRPGQVVERRDGAIGYLPGSGANTLDWVDLEGGADAEQLDELRREIQPTPRESVRPEMASILDMLDTINADMDERPRTADYADSGFPEEALAKARTFEPSGPAPTMASRTFPPSGPRRADVARMLRQRRRR